MQYHEQPAGIRNFIAEAIARAEAMGPDRPAYTFLAEAGGERVLTFGQLAREVHHHSAQYRRKFASGGRIVLCLPGDLEFIVHLLAVICADLVAVPVYPPTEGNSSAISKISRIVDDCAPAAVVSNGPALCGALDTDVQMIDLSCSEAFQIIPRDDAGQAGHALSPACLLQYTSGSTGDPRGVVITNAALAANSAILGAALQLTPQATGVGWLPLYHDMGLMGHVLHPLFIGMHSVLMPPSAFITRPLAWLEAISRHRACISSAPDFAYRLCAQIPAARIARADLDLSCWTLALNGSEPVRRETLELFTASFSAKGFRRDSFFPCYGLAESTLFVSGGRSTAPADTGSSVSCGRPGHGVHIAVVDPESGRELEAGQSGEIWVASPSNGDAYWGRPELSQATFGATLANHPGRKFLRTGDIGRLADGELKLVGRLKNIIIVRGRNLHAEDIENHLTQHVEGLRNGRVCAAAVQHAGTENLVVIAEIAATGRDTSQLERDIRSETHKATSIQPLWVVFVRPKSLSRTSSGKLRRQRCVEMLLAGQLEALSDYTASPASSLDEARNWFEATAVQACREALEAPRSISISHDFFADLGMDSLSATVFAEILSQRISTPIRTGDVYKFPTPELMALRLQELMESTEQSPRSAWDSEADLDFAAEAAPSGFVADRLRCAPDTASRMLAAHTAGFQGNGTILLTGATGFVGPHLVDQLLKQTQSRLVCIVRAKTDEAAAERLRQDMTRYRIWNDGVAERVTCLAGDVARENLGLDDLRYDALCREVDVVFSNAAHVNFLMPYSRLKPTNVGGPQNLLRLCVQGKAKHLVHTSTQGIYEARDHHTVYDEDDRPTGDVVKVAKGYARTKLVAEHLINAVRALGLQATLLRIGMVSGDSAHGICNGDPLIGSLVLGCAQCGAAPDADVTFDMSPVDQVAKGMVAIARQASSINANFNVSEPVGISTREIYAMVQSLGIPLEILPFAAWRERVFAQGARNALARYRWVIKELTHVPPRAFFRVDRAEKFLATARVPMPSMDVSTMSKYFQHYRDTSRFPLQTSGD